jgi:hypothetical protein
MREERWIDEANTLWESVYVMPKETVDYQLFKRGYLAACEKRQEEIVRFEAEVMSMATAKKENYEKWKKAQEEIARLEGELAEALIQNARLDEVATKNIMFHSNQLAALKERVRGAAEYIRGAKHLIPDNYDWNTVQDYLTDALKNLEVE